MTITTWTIAKGIPPRLHDDPKPKGKPHTKKSNTKTTEGSCKRATRDSDDDSGQEKDKVPELVHKAKKKAGKRQHIKLSDSKDVEMVEDTKQTGKDIEEVDDGVGNEQPPDEQEVSPYHLLYALLTHHTLEQWSQWPPTWSQPSRKVCKKGNDTRSPYNNDWQSHCEVHDNCY